MGNDDIRRNCHVIEFLNSIGRTSAGGLSGISKQQRMSTCILAEIARSRRCRCQKRRPILTPRCRLTCFTFTADLSPMQRSFRWGLLRITEPDTVGLIDRA